MFVLLNDGRCIHICWNQKWLVLDVFFLMKGMAFLGDVVMPHINYEMIYSNDKIH